eukprot:scaffold713_cov131-Cylindrotheca_fusiformis.AAC.7
MMKFPTIALSFLLPYLAKAKLGESRQGDRHLQEIPIVQVGADPPNQLKRCEGDCDNDGDCGSGLKCYHRFEPFEPVPGCSGGGQDSSLFDYCIENGQRFPLVNPVALDPSTPLERCEGDCDSDSDCASSDLFCFVRTEANTRVPGCFGGQSEGSLFDYCIRRVDVAPGEAPTAPTPDPSPGPTPAPVSPAPVSHSKLPLAFSENFPLGRCEGDCDSDDDCEHGLVCFQRGRYTSVPGCSGGSSDSSRTDYCVEAGKAAPTPHPTPHPTHPPVSPHQPALPLKISHHFPLGLCEGDCDGDNDCEHGLVCFQRDEKESVPGCLGGFSDHSRTDYCVRANPTPHPTPPPTWTHQPDLPLEISHHFPLGRCEGDCDNDHDCGHGLVCFQRDEYESVPGCSGGSSDGSRSDYCIVPNKPPLRSSHHFPLGLCEGTTGDCDSDHDCEGNLICYQRDAHESVPGCAGGSSDGSRTDYCILS